ncbi:glutaredoxin family protein [Microbacterium sp.]|uniref:glutaredoxin family protein n=1 Tax=Microbacterium sp. TaxID=51671 RepID=UPI0039E3D5F1
MTNTLTVYSRTVCPSCGAAKRLLKSKGIPFTEINVEEDEAGRRRLLEKGFQAVPVFHYAGRWETMAGLRNIINIIEEERVA